MACWALVAGLAWPAAAVTATPAAGRAAERPEPELPGTLGAEPAVAARLERLQEAVEALAADPAGDPGGLAFALGELCRTYLALELLAAAEACLERAVELEPERFDWHYYLGSLHQRERRPEAARRALTGALGVAPSDPAARLRLAQVELSEVRLAAAEGGFAALLEAPGVAAAARHGLGQVALARGDFTAALLHLQEALTLQPDASALHHALATAHRGLGDLEAARRHLALAGRSPVAFADPLIESLTESTQGAHRWRALEARRRGELAVAAEEYRQALAGAPADTRLRQALAGVLFEAGELDDARMEMERVLAQAPEDPSAHLRLAQMLAWAEPSSERALEHFRAALESAPKLGAAHKGAAAILAARGDHAAAARHLAAALERDPTDREARVARARSLSAAGEPDQALAELAAVLASDPLDARALAARGAALLAAGRSAESVVSYQEALRHTAEERFRGVVHLELAEVLALTGDAASALEHARQAGELLPASRPARQLEGELLIHRAATEQAEGDRAAAEATLREVVARAPELRDGHFNLAALLAARGALAEAAQRFGTAAELDPGDAEARRLEARAWLQAGEPRRAREALEEGLAAHPADRPLRALLVPLLATSPDPERRDPERAVALAGELWRDDPSLEHGVLLAAALAAAGRRQEAAAQQLAVLEAARAAGAPPELRRRLEHALERYRSPAPEERR